MGAENLTKWRLFAEMTSAEANVVLGACEERTLVADEELFHENDPGDSIWIVQAGRVDVFKHIRGDVDRVLASLGPGDVIGEVSFVDGSRRSAGARTTEASEFLVLSRQAFEKVAKEQPEVGADFFRNLAAIIAARLRTTNELYKESVIFNLEAVGADALNLKSIAEDLKPVTVHLNGNVSVVGRILQVDHHPAGYTIVVKDKNEKLTIIPYHAIQRIEVA